MKIFNEISKPYIDKAYPAVKLLPTWHGTQKNKIDSIFTIGYSSLTLWDPGFFGRGIYSAYEAEYSYRVYGKGPDGVLIFNWVACYSPLPVVHDDMDRLRGKANYENYDAHFIPVVPQDPDNPYENTYWPRKPGDNYVYNEIVVFETAACLPRYLVELKQKDSKTKIYSLNL